MINHVDRTGGNTNIPTCKKKLCLSSKASHKFLSTFLGFDSILLKRPFGIGRLRRHRSVDDRFEDNLRRRRLRTVYMSPVNQASLGHEILSLSAKGDLN